MSRRAHVKKSAGRNASPKRALYAEFAAVARAFGHEARLDLIEHLAQGERSVEDLAAASGLAFANTSQHLQQLRRAGLVQARRAGKRVLYALADADVVRLVALLRAIAARNLASVEQAIGGWYRGRDALEPLSSRELRARLKAGRVTLLDVRPADEYARGHLPGALNIPLPDLKRRMGEIDGAREVVAYCRGPYCVLAFEAVAELRRRGFAARRLADGLPEWRAAGLPVEAGGARP